MRIQGLQKLTLLDFPERTACTVFTAGCNFRCPFCHNASLVVDIPTQPELSEEEFFAFSTFALMIFFSYSYMICFIGNYRQH